MRPARAATGTVVVNGRFLRATPTGLQRVARQLVGALRAAGQPVEVLAPPGIDDPLVDRTLWAPAGRVGDHAWEQLALPLAAGRRTVLSLVNTAPVLAASSVVMVHDLATVVGPQWFRPEMRFYGRLTLATARRATAVVTPSRQVADELVRAGVRAERVHVVPNAVGPDFRPAAPEAVADVRRRYGLHRPYVVHVGWADPRKNVAMAASAHRAVVGELPHDLVLVGGQHRNFAPVVPPEGDGIRPVGYVPDELLPALLTGADALLYPTRYEGFGLPPVEALACGTAAVVSDVPAVREAAGASARYVDPDDAPGWAEALRAVLRGEHRAGPPPTRTWADMAADVVAVIERLDR